MMRVLIQHKHTGRYLGKNLRWEDSPDAALAFMDETRACDFCIYRKVADSVVVVQPDQPALEDAAETRPATNSPSFTNQPAPSSMKKKTIPNGRNTLSAAKSLNRFSARKTARKKPLRPPNHKRASSESLTPPAPVAPPPDFPTFPASTPECPDFAAQMTTVTARIDVGLGNRLFIRGQGDGLSWEAGIPLQCVQPDAWVWYTDRARGKVVFKLLLNDQL